MRESSHSNSLFESFGDDNMVFTLQWVLSILNLDYPVLNITVSGFHREGGWPWDLHPPPPPPPPPEFGEFIYIYIYIYIYIIVI